MEDCASQRMDLVATVFAFVAFTVSDTVVAGVNDAAVGAGEHTAVCLLEHEVEAGGVVWEPFIELLDRERCTHTTSVLQRLHVVKG